jgi:hypothetical protein
MGRADFLRLGDWNTVCYQCGFKRKGSYLVRNWQGYFVCPEHNEPRQPQDFVKAVPDMQMPPFVQRTPGLIYSYTQTATFPNQADGVNKQFQLGDGLYTTSVTAVFVNGTSIGGWTANGTGLITFTTAPTKYSTVAASGTETAYTS